MSNKTIHFIIQSKGGVGKSFLTYLYALKNQENAEVAFFDLDSSTETTERQLKFLKAKGRVYQVSLLDERRKIIRDRLLSSIKQLVEMEYQELYLDFGAPESEQLPALFSFDFSAAALKKFEIKLNVTFIFHIVIAGNTAYLPSTEYLNVFHQTVGENFSMIVHPNEYTFFGFNHLLDEIRNYCTKNQLIYRPFGDIDTQTDTGNQIIKYVQNGIGLEDYDLLEQMKVESEFEKI
jgi:hypothetical protein